jgi:hypothetical protein
LTGLLSFTLPLHLSPTAGDFIFAICVSRLIVAISGWVCILYKDASGGGGGYQATSPPCKIASDNIPGKNTKSHSPAPLFLKGQQHDIFTTGFFVLSTTRPLIHTLAV